MKEIKPHIIKVFLINFFLFQSCFLFESCPDALPYFTINGININNFKYTNEGLNPWKTIAGDGTLKWNEYFMRVGYDRNFTAQASLKSSYGLYALSCESDGYMGSKIGMDTLFIVTLNNYNELFQANDTINDIILTNDWTYKTEDFDNFQPISTLLNENRETIFNTNFEIKLNEKPSIFNQLHSFKVILVLNNGETFESISETVSLQ